MAILAADVVGYSRMIGADETGTLASLRTLRRDVVEPLVAENGGRVFQEDHRRRLAGGVSEHGAGAEVRDRGAGAASGWGWASCRAVHRGRRASWRATTCSATGSTSRRGWRGWRSPAASAFPGACARTPLARWESRLMTSETPELKGIAAKIQVFRVRLGRRSGLAALALPDKPSLVVLPFQNMYRRS